MGFVAQGCAPNRGPWDAVPTVEELSFATRSVTNIVVDDGHGVAFRLDRKIWIAPRHMIDSGAGGTKAVAGSVTPIHGIGDRAQIVLIGELTDRFRDDWVLLREDVREKEIDLAGAPLIARDTSEPKTGERVLLLYPHHGDSATDEPQSAGVLAAEVVDQPLSLLGRRTKYEGCFFVSWGAGLPGPGLSGVPVLRRADGESRLVGMVIGGVRSSFLCGAENYPYLIVKSIAASRDPAPQSYSGR